MNTPLVSICCITYNHAQFIRKCLDGFLMQQTDFPIEILIHDDCSTDGTTEIIREYETKYPDLIFPLYEEENQYSRGVAGKMDLYNYRRARGKYIAYCEGDDYWTDSQKLQKQVDFMEANPEYSVCFHDFQKYDIRNNKWVYPAYGGYDLSKNGGLDVSNAMFLKYCNLGQPLTMLFRVDMYDFSWSNQYKYFRDTHEIYHLLCVGKGRILDFVGGVYNLHNGGVSTSLTTPMSALIVRETYKELYKYNSHDQVIQEFLFDALLWNYYVCNSQEFLSVWYDIVFICPRISFQVLCTIFKRTIKRVLKS